MTPTPFWPRGLPASGSAPSHLSSPDCRPILTGYRLARVIVQRHIFVKKFCRPTARHPTNRTVEPLQLSQNIALPVQNCTPLRALARVPPAREIAPWPFIPITD